MFMYVGQVIRSGYTYHRLAETLLTTSGAPSPISENVVPKTGGNAVFRDYNPSKTAVSRFEEKLLEIRLKIVHTSVVVAVVGVVAVVLTLIL